MKQLFLKKWNIVESLAETWTESFQIYNFFTKRGFTIPFCKESMTNYDTYDYTLIWFAVLFSRIEMAKWLRNNDLLKEDQLTRGYGYKTSTPTYAAAQSNNLIMLKWIFSIIGDAGFGLVNSDGKSPCFHPMLSQKNKHVIKWFILNSEPGAFYLGDLDDNEYSTFGGCLSSCWCDFNGKLVLRRWATFALAQQKIKAKKRKMLQWLLDGLSQVKVTDTKTLQDFPDWETNFTLVSYCDKDEEWYVKVKKNEAKERAEETDPLMKIWLPPVGHYWESTTWDHEVYDDD